MANYFIDTLKVKSIYVLDDSGAYGVGIADAFQKQAEKRGIKVLGRDQLNPKGGRLHDRADQDQIAEPGCALLRWGGAAGVKVVKQSYDIMPKMIRAGGDGVYGAEILKGAGFPAAEGLYATIAAPNLLEVPEAKPFVEKFAKKYGQQRRTIRSPPMMLPSSSSTRSNGLPPPARRSTAPMCAMRSRIRTSRRCRARSASTKRRYQQPGDQRLPDQEGSQ